MGIERIVGDGVVSLVLTSRENAAASGCDILAAFGPDDVSCALNAVPHDDAVHGVSHAAQGLTQFVVQMFDDRLETGFTSALPSLKTVSDAVLGASSEEMRQKRVDDDVSKRWNDEEGSDTPIFKVPMHWPDVNAITR
ncbi:MAG: hypothetical protein AAYR33_05965 [Acetobacteraceae bacterium]